jgi:Trk K+ transport system NAD-binding subunit
LVAEGIDTRIIEKQPDRIRDTRRYVEGDAADLAVLQRAGFSSASAILITTHDDDLNIYLTIYCRQLAPEMQIISRSNMERNVATLHRAGADSVLSYASQGATAILNAFGDSDHLMLAEGLEMFSVPTPSSIAGQTLAQARIPELTWCNIVGVIRDGHTTPNPEPDVPIPTDAALIVIGSVEAERRFLERFPLEVGRASLRGGNGR